jgi:hypothetical protein
MFTPYFIAAKVHADESMPSTETLNIKEKLYDVTSLYHFVLESKTK